MTEKDIGRLLSELNNLIHRQIIKNENCSTNECDSKNSCLSYAGSCIIAFLHDHYGEDIFQKDLEQEFQVRRSTMSKVLTLLEQKGYIQRISVDADRRLKKIVVTNKADCVVDKLKKDREELEQQMIKGISNEDIAQFKEIAQKIKNNLSQEEAN